MDHIHRIPVEEKCQHMAKLNFGEIPNSNINRAIDKVTCPSVGALLECAREELATVERICMLPIQEAANMRGNM
jgi:hypothetical protein